MANPFGYGEFIPNGRAAYNTAGLEMSKWSSEVQRLGMERLVFAPQLTPRFEFGVGEGGTIVVPVPYWDRSLSGTTALVEGTSITVGTYSITNFKVMVSEYAKAYAWPNMLDLTVNQSNKSAMLETLVFNSALTIDALALSVFASSAFTSRTIAAGSMTLVASAGGGTLGGTVAYDGTMLDTLYNQMRADRVPTFPDGYYRIIGRNTFFTTIKSEADWKNVQLWNQGGAGIIAQDLGVYKGFRLIATEENLAAGSLAYAFGPAVGVIGWANGIEIREEANWKQDFGRLSGYAWFARLGVAAALRDLGTHCWVLKTS